MIIVTVTRTDMDDMDDQQVQVDIAAGMDEHTAIAGPTLFHLSQSSFKKL